MTSTGGADAALDEVVVATRAWIERAVIGLNLCPFAKPVYVKEQVRYIVSTARTAEALLEDLGRELQLLVHAEAEDVDTTLLIHPYALTDFSEYNQFLGVVDAAVDALGLRGVVQIASFHPRYQFEGTTPDDITNCTNRSPYPILQILREASVTRVVEAFRDADSIYRRNMETMRRLGAEGWRALGLEP